MKKLIKRVTCFFFAVLVLCVSFPFSAFAVDPVSAGVMANAFAQAIAAYGAANGAAMTFDVSNTSSIGETVHELWADFRAGTQDADDYETLAAALFPDLYYKAVSAAGTAVEAATVGYNISSEYAEEFDNFWNWLLSGPAEMVKVDNQYFQFASAQIGPSAVPLVLIDMSSFSKQPVAVVTTSAECVQNGIPFGKSGVNNNYFWFGAGSSGQYAFCVPQSSTYVYVVFVSESSAKTYKRCSSSSSDGSNPGSLTSYGIDTLNASTNLYYDSRSQSAANPSGVPLPYFSTAQDGLDALRDYLDGNSPVAQVGVKAAANTGVASFPDTADPNYEAVAKRIPSDVPWDDSLFGDGTGTMTDAQSQAAAETADDVIERDKTLPLAGDETTNPPSDEDPPSSDPDDYMVLGLEDVFPFCIPFDIYNFLAALSAAPVAPHFVCTLDFPDAIGGEQTIDIDFDTPVFNQLAQLLRTLELLAFIVGLALLTRSMFIRG